MRKEITVNGQSIPFQCSALVPRIYRKTIGRDVMIDISKLQESYSKILDKKNKEKKEFDAIDLEIFENIAWVMAYHAYKSDVIEANKIAEPEAREEALSKLNVVANTPDEWLESIEGAFSIYEILPQILEVWGGSSKTTSSPRKK